MNSRSSMVSILDFFFFIFHFDSFVAYRRRRRLLTFYHIIFCVCSFAAFVQGTNEKILCNKKAFHHGFDSIPSGFFVSPKSLWYYKDVQTRQNYLQCVAERKRIKANMLKTIKIRLSHCNETKEFYYSDETEPKLNKFKQKK